MMFRLCTILVLVGCYPPAEPTVPAYCTNEAALTAALVRCVDRSETRAAYNACRAETLGVCGIAERASL